MQDWTSFCRAVRVGGWVIYPLTLLAIARARDRARSRLCVLALCRLAGHAGVRPPGLRHQARRPCDRLRQADCRQQHAFTRLSAPWCSTITVVPLWLIEAKAQAVAAQIERDMSRGFWVSGDHRDGRASAGSAGHHRRHDAFVPVVRRRWSGQSGRRAPAAWRSRWSQPLSAWWSRLFALFAFNYFSRRLERLMDELESFANERLSDIRLAGERPRSAAMKFRRSRASKRGRIEIIPMIDVMFFLLATFMLASLAMQRLDAVKVTCRRATRSRCPRMNR